MTEPLPRAEDTTRHLTLQYLLLAFSQLRIRHEALRCLDDLLAFLCGAPREPLPEGVTRGELAAAYLDELSRDGHSRECDFRWLRDDPDFENALVRYRGQLGNCGVVQ